MATIEKYGALWPEHLDDLKIEMACIVMGGHWTGKEGQPCGRGLPYHYHQMRGLIWPELLTHRWYELCRDELCKNKITTIMGPGSTGKTHIAAWYFLSEYFVFPQETLVMVSSTDIRGLRLRVWGEIVQLWERAKDRFPYLAGNLLDSKLAIATDNLEEEGARDLRKGIIGIPCIQNGKFVGLGKFVGVKQKRLRLIADEAQFMAYTFLSAFANLNQNVDFRAAVLGNPNDVQDSLGKAAEPVDGWGSHLSPDKTAVWDTRFMSGRCINLVGMDSPNMDAPPGTPMPFPFLLTRQKADQIRRTFGEESLEYQSQCLGTMKTGLLERRVLTREMCQQFGAFDSVLWKGTGLTRIYGLDAAYGGDRCVGGYIEFGEDATGKIILSVGTPHIIPIRIAVKEAPEDQIAARVRVECESLGIPPENMFHDATGRGSLGTSLARLWSAQTNPVEFGGRPSDRPVSLDHFLLDPQTRTRRLKLCHEHYANFVTELWYSVRYAVEAAQVRNFPVDVMEEMTLRRWDQVRGDKIQVEPKTGTPGKPGMKERTGRSPDLGDWFAICLEGARRRGFKISKLANEEDGGRGTEYLQEHARRMSKLHASKQLDYAA